jgi:Protein of unknown function (DUF2849)
VKVLTANRLTDGEAVWFARDNRWSESMADSELATDADAEARLEAIGKAAFDNNEVVDVNLIDVQLVAGAIKPLRLREQIRAAGPTNRVDLGKQAKQTDDYAI